MKRPIKDGSYNREGCNEIICYPRQLCDRAEKAGTHNNKPFVPFIEVNKESFGQGFDPTDLLGSDPEKKPYARNLVRNIAKMMCEENKARITHNLENVAKNVPSDRVYNVCVDDFSNSSLISNQILFKNYLPYLPLLLLNIYLVICLIMKNEHCL